MLINNFSICLSLYCIDIFENDIKLKVKWSDCSLKHLTKSLVFPAKWGFRFLKISHFSQNLFCFRR